MTICRLRTIYHLRVVCHSRSYGLLPRTRRGTPRAGMQTGEWSLWTAPFVPQFSGRGIPCRLRYWSSVRLLLPVPEPRSSPGPSPPKNSGSVVKGSIGWFLFQVRASPCPTGTFNSVVSFPALPSASWPNFSGGVTVHTAGPIRSVNESKGSFRGRNSAKFNPIAEHSRHHFWFILGGWAQWILSGDFSTNLCEIYSHSRLLLIGEPQQKPRTMYRLLVSIILDCIGRNLIRRAAQNRIQLRAPSILQLLFHADECVQFQ